MKTKKQPSFTILENEFLENILRQMVNQYTIVQLFYNKATAVTGAQLIIHLDKKTDADNLQSAKWVAKAQSIYNINVHCMYTTRLHHQHALGHPFIETYCRPSAVVYQMKRAGIHCTSKGNGKSTVKSSRTLTNSFTPNANASANW